MKVLLTGGAGFIGSHTFVELIKDGYTPIIVDNLYNSSERVLERLEKISGVKPIFYKIDVCDKNACRSVFKEHNISSVIHFAGYKAVGESVNIPLSYTETTSTAH